MSLLLELSMAPLGKGESVTQDVAKIMDVIDKSGIRYKLGPMGTCLEGEWDEIMDVVKECFQTMKKDHHRIMVSIKADYREGKSGRIQSKIESVEKELGRPLRK